MKDLEIYYQTTIVKTDECSLEQWLSEMKVAKNKINYLFQNGCCFINGVSANPESILHQNDYLMIDISNFENNPYAPLDIKVDIIYEDDYLLVVNKPSGYIIYPEDVCDNQTMASIITNYYQSTGQNHGIHHVHRLDKETTGCLIYAKDIITLAKLSYDFENKHIKKTYLALVNQKIEKNGIIESPIGSDRHQNGKMAIVKNGAAAQTKYYVEKNVGNNTLLKIVITSGRTHQIRVHLSSIGYPLIGDTLYGSKQKANRVMLHSSQIALEDPVSGIFRNFEAPFPKDFVKYLRK